MTPLGWLGLWIAAAIALLGLGWVGAYPVGFRRGYAAAVTEEPRHRKGDPLPPLPPLPKAGRIPLERLADPTPLPGEDDWRFAGSWDQGPVAASAEYELLMPPAPLTTLAELERPLPTHEESCVACTDETDSGFTRRQAREVTELIARWDAETNYLCHTMRAD